MAAYQLTFQKVKITEPRNIDRLRHSSKPENLQ